MSKRNTSAPKIQPDPPKKPVSGYIRFTCDNREAFKKKNPDLNNKEMIKLLAEEWNKLSEGQKKKFSETYEKEKKKYEEEIKSYENKYGPIKSKKKKEKEEKEDEEKEKKGKKVGKEKEKKSVKGGKEK